MPPCKRFVSVRMQVYLSLFRVSPLVDDLVVIMSNSRVFEGTETRFEVVLIFSLAIDQ